MIDRREYGVLLGTCILLPGCTLSGTWKAVDQGSHKSGIPIEVMTFEGDHFSATTDGDGQPETIVGLYHITARRLILRPTDRPEQVFRIRRTLGGGLRLSPDDKRSRSNVKFAKVKEPRPPSRHQD